MNDTFFYVGSCRYMNFFAKNFPARMHSTKEIIQFLENIGNIKSQLSNPLINVMYGDINHPIVKEKSQLFIENEETALLGIKNFVMEVSSRKYSKSNNDEVLCSYYYKKKDSVINQSDKDVEDDIIKIKEILKKKFNIENIFILPHLDLKLPDGSHIEDRKIFRNLLSEISKKNGINFLDISLAFSNGEGFFDAAFSDTTHYSREGNKIVSDWLRLVLSNEPS